MDTPKHVHWMCKTLRNEHAIVQAKNVMCIFTHGLNKKSILMFIDLTVMVTLKETMDSVYKFNTESLDSGQ